MKTTILKAQWNGEPYKGLPYQLALNENTLFFSVEFPDNAFSNHNSTPREYSPELWKFDVGEVFITGESNYLEVNLAPNLAFWLQGFSSVRQADQLFTYQDLQPTVCQLGLSLSLSKLERYLGPKDKWRFNVTAILESPNQVFLSECVLPGTEADFHQPKYWSLQL